MTDTIILIEDDDLIGEMVRFNLESEGFAVRWRKEGHDLHKELAARPADLIVLDVMLPGPDGFTIARDLRARGFATPILMLTSLNEVQNKVRGLDGGADDYLTKPFEMEEFLARVRAQLRRHTTPHDTEAAKEPTP